MAQAISPNTGNKLKTWHIIKVQIQDIAEKYEHIPTAQPEPPTSQAGDAQTSTATVEDKAVHPAPAAETMAVDSQSDNIAPNAHIGQ